MITEDIEYFEIDETLYYPWGPEIPSKEFREAWIHALSV